MGVNKADGLDLGQWACVGAQACGMEQRVEVSAVDNQSWMNPSEVRLEQVLSSDSSVVNGEVVALGALDKGRQCSLQEGCDGRGEKIPKIGDLNVGGMRRGELCDGHVRCAEDGGEGPQCPWGAVQGPGRG